MFWFVFIFALFIYGVCHIAHYFRMKAVESGESKIGLFAQSICPFCRKCKISMFVMVVFLLFTAFLMGYSEGRITEWSFLLLNHNEWTVIHVIIGIFFAITFVTYFYIHTEAITTGFKRLFRFKFIIR
jgi:hypothetical protein